MDCEYEATCQNNTKCFRCFDQNLLKLGNKPWQKQKTVSKNNFVQVHDEKAKNAKNSWENLEQEVANSLNNAEIRYVLPLPKLPCRYTPFGLVPFLYSFIKFFFVYFVQSDLSIGLIKG